jgi:hypothetical protein
LKRVCRDPAHHSAGSADRNAREQTLGQWAFLAQFDWEKAVSVQWNLLLLLFPHQSQPSRHTKGGNMDGVTLLVFALFAGCLSNVFGRWLAQERSSGKREKMKKRAAEYLTARIACDRPDGLAPMKQGKYPSVRAAARHAGTSQLSPRKTIPLRKETR